MLHRVNEVINNPRDFVRVGAYFGPCRRRKIDHDYVGEERRGVPESERAQVFTDASGQVSPEPILDPEDIY
ncbi:hypothetical protein D3C86_2256310 [compost metagenome]